MIRSFEVRTRTKSPVSIKRPIARVRSRFGGRVTDTPAYAVHRVLPIAACFNYSDGQAPLFRCPDRVH